MSRLGGASAWSGVLVLAALVVSPFEAYGQLELDRLWSHDTDG